MLLILATSCAHTEFENLEDGTIYVTCSGWKVACDTESQKLCGVDNYDILSDETLSCDINATNHVKNCTWRFNIRCKEISKVPEKLKESRN